MQVVMINRCGGVMKEKGAGKTLKLRDRNESSRVAKGITKCGVW